MHAVVVRVTIKDGDSAETELRERVVPAVSQMPGFKSGNWTRKDNTGMSMLIFESEEAAESAAAGIGQNVPAAVDLEGVEVREVVASA
jgi:hypothetical protein